MLQRLAVTNPKNDKMDTHGVNPTMSIFLPTPFPVAMQGIGATAPWEKDLRPVYCPGAQIASQKLKTYQKY